VVFEKEKKRDSAGPQKLKETQKGREKKHWHSDHTKKRGPVLATKKKRRNRALLGLKKGRLAAADIQHPPKKRKYFTHRSSDKEGGEKKENVIHMGRYFC